MTAWFPLALLGSIFRNCALNFEAQEVCVLFASVNCHYFFVFSSTYGSSHLTLDGQSQVICQFLRPNSFQSTIYQTVTCHNAVDSTSTHKKWTFLFRHIYLYLPQRQQERTLFFYFHCVTKFRTKLKGIAQRLAQYCHYTAAAWIPHWISLAV